MRSNTAKNWMAIAGLVGTLSLAGTAMAADGTPGDAPKSKENKSWSQHGDGHRSSSFKGMRGGKAGPMRELRGLDLTDEQRSQVRTIMETSRTQNKARWQEIQTLRKQLKASVDANGFDEANVRAQIEAGAPLMTELMVDRFRTQAQIRNVLTPEQLQKLDERRTERQKRHEERRGRMEKKRGQ